MEFFEVDSIPKAESFQRYRELFRQAPIGILRTTINGHILLANRALVDMLGYNSYEEFLSLAPKVTDLYEDSQFRQHLTDAIAQQKDRPVHFESRWRRKNGTFFPCGIHVRASIDNLGIIQYFEGFIEDTTKKKALEKALLASSERYRSIFENTGTGTIIVEKDTTISLANTGFANLIGYSKDEIEGKMLWKEIVAKEDDLNKMLSYHFKRRDSAANVPIEYEFTLKDRYGNHKNVIVRVDIISGTDCSVASILDITSLKLADKSRWESESRLTGVLEAFDGYIYMCSSDYHLVYMNRKLEKTMDPVNDSLLCYKRIFGFNSPCFWCSQKSVFQGETIKYEFKEPQGNRWYYAVSSPVYEGDNLIIQTQTVMIDIHERKLAEMALEERDAYLQKENQLLRNNIRDRYKFGTIIGKSKVMQDVYELILRAAATDANVILYGESGTGKELVSKEIHYMSDRKESNFLPVNCGAIPGQLMESEFFGYIKGAFTGADRDKLGYFAKSDHGTLFLDELGEIDDAMQVKLLRVLEGNGYIPLGGLESVRPDVRIISATNRNLRSMLDEGFIREDFFYRIHIIPINLPPLRDRLEDIPLLVEHFMTKHSKGANIRVLNGNDYDRLMQHRWPGNVRELENTIQRFINLDVLDFVLASDDSNDIAKLSKAEPKPIKNLNLREAARQLEKECILQQLEACHWNRTRTAKVLGIQRKTLYLKMKLFGIVTPPQ